uniref:SOCS box domain-containing protein n=1 Tax=Trichogramma kaykai TaxID=54128 RepID=A0ABD2WK13_9HYME
MADARFELFQGFIYGILDNQTSREQFERLKSMRENVNWDNEVERRELFDQLRDVFWNWNERLPNLGDIFRRDEMDWLLAECIKTDDAKSPPHPILHFAIAAGYRDEPESGAETSARRTTPLHQLFKFCSFPYWNFVARDLFQIYNRFDVNYVDERGRTHFHAACQYGCNEAVRRFLESGLDLKRLARETDLTAIDPPLHLALDNQNEEVFKLLLKHGADPNSANEFGETPLHDISTFHGLQGFGKIVFEIGDETNQTLQVDARNSRGLKPLHFAVKYFQPDMVELLLNRGADMSDFVFPRDCFEDDEPYDYKECEANLIMAYRMLEVIELLENKGYEMDRTDGFMIVSWMQRYFFGVEIQDFDFWGRHGNLVDRAKELMVIPSLSLYDLIEMRSDEAKRLLAHKDYYEFVTSIEFRQLPRKFREDCLPRLCEKMCRKFFWRWALQPLLEFTHQRLPILCCERIMNYLKNEDLYTIFDTVEMYEEDYFVEDT